MKLGPILERKLETTAGEKTVREMIEGDRPTVFISYPMNFTPVCTKQLCSYRDDWENLASLPCRWWGINRFSIEKHRRFRAQHDFPFDLVSDPSGDLLEELKLKGLLWTRRGFALISPEGDVLDSTSGFPAFYRKPGEVKTYIEALLT